MKQSILKNYSIITISFLFISFPVILSCQSHLSVRTISPGKTYLEKTGFKTGRFSRSYLIHVPSGYTPANQYPLVVMLHGAFSTAGEMEEKTGLSTLADREDFLVLYPNGIGIMGFLQHWNAGFCCGKAMADDIDDVGFITYAIDDVCQKLSVDRSRIYMSGYSNGAMMACRYVSAHPEKIAAVAVLAGAIGGRSGPEVPFRRVKDVTGPMPAIIFHSSGDTHIPLGGGQNPDKKSEREFLPLTELKDYWIRSNQCGGTVAREALFGGKVVREQWTDCMPGGNVTLLVIDGWPHIWPGRFFTDELEAGNALKGFDAAEIMWDFLKDISKN